jgi:hypothetical protein
VLNFVCCTRLYYHLHNNVCNPLLLFQRLIVLAVGLQPFILVRGVFLIGTKGRGLG